MAEVLLFHHALGQTAGFHSLADELRRAGHTVHTPDLYDGRAFPTLAEGMAHAKEIGFGALKSRGEGAAAALQERLVYVGFSLGVLQRRSSPRRVRVLSALCCSIPADAGATDPKDGSIDS